MNQFAISAKSVNGILWTINILLCSGVMLLAVQYLYLPPEYDMPEFIEPDPPEPTPNNIVDLGPFIDLSNPMVHMGGSFDVGKHQCRLEDVVLIGTLPDSDPGKAAAFLEIRKRRLQVPAFIGKPVVDRRGCIVPELKGWNLVKVFSDHVVLFGKYSRKVLHLLKIPLGSAEIKEAAWDPDKTGRYYPSRYQSRLLSKNANRQVWGIDPEEADFAIKNQEAILSRDVTLSMYPDGGVKIEAMRQGSLPAVRGLKVDDVVRTVNGRRIGSVRDIKSMMESGSMRRLNRLFLSVQRGGRTITFEYILEKE